MANISISDDCIYRFYICSERVGTWSENKNTCNIHFEKCHNYITGRNKNLEMSTGESSINGSLNLSLSLEFKIK